MDVSQLAGGFQLDAPVRFAVAVAVALTVGVIYECRAYSKDGWYAMVPALLFAGMAGLASILLMVLVFPGVDPGRVNAGIEAHYGLSSVQVDARGRSPLADGWHTVDWIRDGRHETGHMLVDAQAKHVELYGANGERMEAR